MNISKISVTVSRTLNLPDFESIKPALSAEVILDKPVPLANQGQIEDISRKIQSSLETTMDTMIKNAKERHYRAKAEMMVMSVAEVKPSAAPGSPDDDLADLLA